jgi:hypothetical protein
MANEFAYVTLYRDKEAAYLFCADGKLFVSTHSHLFEGNYVYEEE